MNPPISPDVLEIAKAVGSVAALLGLVWSYLASKRSKAAAKSSAAAGVQAQAATSAAAGVLSEVQGMNQRQVRSSSATTEEIRIVRQQLSQLATAHAETLDELKKVQRAGKHRDDVDEPPAPAPEPEPAPDPEPEESAPPARREDPNPSTSAVWAQLAGET